VKGLQLLVEATRRGARAVRELCEAIEYSPSLAGREAGERWATDLSAAFQIGSAHAALDQAGLERVIAADPVDEELSLTSRILNLVHDRDEAVGDLEAARAAVVWLSSSVKTRPPQPKKVAIAIMNALGQLPEDELAFLRGER